MLTLSPEETDIVRQALQAWLRKIAEDAFYSLRRDPSLGHQIIDRDTATVERIIEKLQF